MSITPEQLLDLAKSITADSEVQIRDAIGRAYYAAYHTAKLFHAAMPTPGALPTKNCGVHGELIHQLKNPRTSIGNDQSIKSKQIGYILHTIKPIRKRADYDLDLSMNSTELQQIIKETEKIQIIAAQTKIACGQQPTGDL